MSPALKTASILAFERKLDPSDALLHSGNWADRDTPEWAPVALREKYVRGTISNRIVKKADLDPAKIDAKIEQPNLQSVDVATLPADADTLRVSFTLRVIGGAGTPSACNSVEYQAKLKGIVDTYMENFGFKELSRRYAINLANGRFLWRNRIGVEEVEVRVTHIEKGQTAASWSFDALTFGLHSFDVPQDKADDIEALTKLIESGLSGERPVLLHIAAFVRSGAGQEVFPSQELSLDRSRGDKSKILYQVNGIAAMHSQKIGNAIRTIDDWHPVANETGPIAVEPYGSVTSLGRACRQPKEKKDFYSLLDGWVCNDKVPSEEDQHFVIATLVRGGVFGEAKEK